MQLKLTHTAAGNTRLLLLFAGWGTDPSLYSPPGVEGYDMMVAWDYTDTAIDTAAISRYDEIAVIGYSFGVTAASTFLNAFPQLPVTARIAVNGTCHPVDDTRGIPRAIFDGTLAGLNPRSLAKFYRRMAGSGKLYEEILPCLPPAPDTDSLKAQLEAIGSRGSVTADWDMAIVSDNDLIIPTENQLRAWREADVPVKVIAGGHLPDFSSIFRTVLTDKDLVASRFSGAIATYDRAASIQRHIAGRLVELWNPGPEESLDILEIGCGTGMSTRLYLDRVTPRSLRLWDLSPAPSLPAVAEVTACDAEVAVTSLPGESLDVVFSSSTIQWFNSPGTFLRRCADALRPGGKMVVSTFGPETFRTLHSLTGITPSYLDVNDLRRIVPRQTDIIAITDETVSITFDSAADMMRHIRATGVNALASTGTVAASRRILNDYPRQEDGSVSLTYQPIYIILQKRKI